MAAFPACERGGDKLTVYSGRSHSLVDPLLQSFAEETGIEVRVKYASSAAIASTILEEGDGTPADVVFLQDPGSLGALSGAGVLKRLPDGGAGASRRAVPIAHGRMGRHVRARPDGRLQHGGSRPGQLTFRARSWTSPTPVWKGRLGWAPPNGSFQAFVTAIAVAAWRGRYPPLARGHEGQRRPRLSEQHIYSRRRRAGRDRRRIRKPLLPGPLPQGGGPPDSGRETTS